MTKLRTRARRAKFMSGYRLVHANELARLREENARLRQMLTAEAKNAARLARYGAGGMYGRRAA